MDLERKDETGIGLGETAGETAFESDSNALESPDEFKNFTFDDNEETEAESDAIVVDDDYDTLFQSRMEPEPSQLSSSAAIDEAYESYEKKRKEGRRKRYLKEQALIEEYWKQHHTTLLDGYAY